MTTVHFSGVVRTIAFIVFYFVLKDSFNERQNTIFYFDYLQTCLKRCGIKLMKGKALRKHSLHEKTAASVLLKLFISSNE